MSTAQIVWNDSLKKYSLLAGRQTIASSHSAEYLQRIVVNQKNTKVLRAKITKVEMTNLKPFDNGLMVTSPNSTPVVPEIPPFSIKERFEFLEELIMLVIDGDAKSLVISGEGGVGKTHTVLKTMSNAGKINVNTILPSLDDLDIVPDDNEEEIEDKILSQIDKPKGDFIVVKGHSSPKALYRLMYENRDRTIIFDDCDSVLKDSDAISLFKSALDTYEDRWVSWYVEKSFGQESDLPLSFKFKGNIIFISNMPLYKIDEAVKTRCFKVDLSMTKPQRIEHMRNVIHDVMPDVDTELKHESLNLLEEHMHVTEDINFRSLMNVITIRNSKSKNWKKLGVYALMTENV